MPIVRTWGGLTLATIYLVVAIYIAQHEVRFSDGGWINLRGFGTRIATAPSQLTVGVLLQHLGVPPINYGRPGPAGYCQIVLHIVVTAGCMFGLGWGVEWLIRRGLHSI